MHSAILSAESLTVRAGRRKLLDSVTLELSTGNLSVLAGPVGAGKSVLSRVIAGLLQPDDGTVYFEGNDLRDKNIRRPGGIGIVFQEAAAHLLGSTVAEDVMIGPATAKVSYRQQCSMRDHALHMCGIEAIRDQPVHLLSGGESRLTALAAAIAMQPAVLICDEPFANLDWFSVDRVLRVLIAAAERGSSVLVVTHELEKVLAHAHQMFVLDAGTLTHSLGVPADLTRFNREELRRRGLRVIEPITAMTWLTTPERA